MWNVVRRFLELPSKQRMTIATSSILLLLSLGYFGVLAPGYVELRDLKSRQVEISTLQSAEERLQVALQSFSEEQDIPELLKSVADNAREVGLEVISLRPEHEEQRESLVELPVAMSVEGTFHQLVSFFDALGRQSLVMNIRGLEMSNSRSAAQGQILKADFSVVTFRRLSTAKRDSNIKLPKEG